MPLNDTHKTIWKRIGWEFLPPLVLAVAWIFFRYIAPASITPGKEWLDGIRDFSVAFFMLSWLWSQYNRIEYQTATKQHDERLRTEIINITQTIGAMKEEVAGLASKPASVRVAKLAELLNTADHQLDEAKFFLFLKEKPKPKLWYPILHPIVSPNDRLREFFQVKRSDDDDDD